MRSLRVDVAGGGPGGLFLARLLRLSDPTTEVRVDERNGPDDAFGFGVVFSDRTMSSFESADPHTHELIAKASVAWSDMEIRLPDGRLRYSGYGFTAISRQTLLHILQQQAVDVGVELRFHHELAPGATRPQPDPRHIVVYADGASSANRDQHADQFGTTVDVGSARYIWFGTEAMFDAVTFPFVNTRHGVFAAHAYPYGDGLSTFIVEADEPTVRAAGMDISLSGGDRPGTTDDHSRELLAVVFADHLSGRPLIGNNSRWGNFRVVRNARWSARNMVLLGDAAHTAHFSVGSGTKLAMQDAIALAGALGRADVVSDAFAAYEAARRRPVMRTQALAERSMRWWESFGRRIELPPHRFGLHFVTRTAAISLDGLGRRHADRIAEAEAEFTDLTLGQPAARCEQPVVRPRTRWLPPSNALNLPVTLGPLRLPTRVAIQLPGGSRRQPQLAATASTMASLVLADLRAGRAIDTGWLAQSVAISEAGAVPGIMVDSTVPADTVRAFLAAGEARLVEATDQAAGPSIMDTVDLLLSTVDTAGSGSAVCAGLRCPPDQAWSALGDEWVDRCRGLARRGVAGLHLHDHQRGWHHLLSWADRIRTESGLPVLIDGPAGWARRLPDDDAVDDWADRFHVALVSGRVDVVVAWPLGDEDHRNGLIPTTDNGGMGCL